MRKLSAWERAEILRRAADLLDARGRGACAHDRFRGRQATDRSAGRGGAHPGASADECVGRCAHARRDRAGRLGRERRRQDWRSRCASRAGSSSRSRRSTYPALLVAHKVGPALAAGNAVVLKPARQTPLTALLLTRTLLEAGLPENAIQCVTGSGAELGARSAPIRASGRSASRGRPRWERRSPASPASSASRSSSARTAR